MDNFPDDIKRIIWSFDRTYHVKYKTCVRHIKECKKKHISREQMLQVKAK